MKTQVLQIDVHDDFISIRDRMTWAKTPRILLVWPLRGKVNVRPLDLTLLRRHAETLGAEMGLVTRDRRIRQAARSLHISVFSKISDAQKKQWFEKSPSHPVRRFKQTDLREVRKNLPFPDLFSSFSDPARRILMFTFGVLAVFSLVLVFIPSAEIRITMPEKEQAVVFTIRAEPDAKTVEISGVVPQRKLSQFVDGTETALVTGNSVYPDQAATGRVVLMNLSENVVNVPAGTILFTNTEPPIIFLTEEEIKISPGKGKIAKAPIRAKLPGLSGNVEPGVVTLIDGLLSQKVVVTNSEATAGGSQSTQAVATEEDRIGVKKRLLANLQRKALAQFSELALSGDVLFQKSITQGQVMEEKFEPAVGEAGNKIKLSMRVEFTISYASSADLNALARRILDASIPSGFSPLDDAITLKTVTGFSQSQEIIHWQMRAERSMRSLLNPWQVISTSQGKSKNVANKLLMESLGLADEPDIIIRPGWWPWLPFLPNRIEVKG